MPLQQYNYWEHIIRSQRSLERIRDQLQKDPARWVGDQQHPDAVPDSFEQWLQGRGQEKMAKALGSCGMRLQGW